MLRITIPSMEFYNDGTGEFMTIKGQTLQLEHSLVSLSKWESKWNKPFLSKDPKTREESVDYIRCMTLTQNVNPEVYLGVTDAILNEVNRYIDAPMTATTISKKDDKKAGREIVTAEIIYYWMISLQIPFDPCQKWHLNRLITLVNVCSIKNQPKKKMSRKEAASQQRALNNARRARAHSKG